MAKSFLYGSQRTRLDREFSGIELFSLLILLWCRSNMYINSGRIEINKTNWRAQFYFYNNLSLQIATCMYNDEGFSGILIFRIFWNDTKMSMVSWERKKKALRLRIDLILISIVAKEREKKFCWLTGGKGCVQRKTVNNYLTFMQVNLKTLEIPSEITKNEKMTLPVGRFFISN